MNHTLTRISFGRRLAVLVVVAGLAVALSACSSSKKGASSSSGAAITILNFKFSTNPVAAGSTVTVQNNDSTTHTVTADDGSFNVKVNAGKTATFKAPATAGSVKFHCNIHSTMHGVLTVT